MRNAPTLGIEPILPSTITPGKSGFTGGGGGYEPAAPFRDKKNHITSDDPAAPDSSDNAEDSDD